MGCLKRYFSQLPSLFFLSFFILQSASAKVEYLCFHKLQQASATAQEFASYLERIRANAERPVDPANIDPAIRDSIIGAVEGAKWLDVSHHAEEVLFEGRIDADKEDLPRQAVVKVLNSKYYRPEDYNFLRFFPAELQRGDMLRELTLAVASGNFVTKETHRNGAGFPEIFGETDIKIVTPTPSGPVTRVYPVRFAIALDPRHSNPLLSMLSPLVTPNARNRVVTVFVPPFSDNFVVTVKYDKGNPSKSVFVRGRDLVNLKSEAKAYSEITNPSRELLDSHLRRIRQQTLENRGVLPRPSSEALAVKALLDANAPIAFKNSAKNKFSWLADSRARSLEELYASIASEACYNADPQRFFMTALFPLNVSMSQVKDALRAKIVKGEYSEIARDNKYSSEFFAETEVTVDGITYAIEAALGIAQNDANKVTVRNLRILMKPGLSTNAVGVYLDPSSHQFIVITKWEDALPSEGALVWLGN